MPPKEKGEELKKEIMKNQNATGISAMRRVKWHPLMGPAPTNNEAESQKKSENKINEVADRKEANGTEKKVENSKKSDSTLRERITIDFGSEELKEKIRDNVAKAEKQKEAEKEVATEATIEATNKEKKLDISAGIDANRKEIQERLEELVNKPLVISKVVQEAKAKRTALGMVKNFFVGFKNGIVYGIERGYNISKNYIKNSLTVYVPGKISNAYEGSKLQSAVKATKNGIKIAGIAVKDAAVASARYVKEKYTDSALDHGVRAIASLAVTAGRKIKDKSIAFAKTVANGGVYVYDKALVPAANGLVSLGLYVGNKAVDAGIAVKNAYQGSKLQTAVKTTGNFFKKAGLFVANKAKAFANATVDFTRSTATKIADTYRESKLRVLVQKTSNKAKEVGNFVADKTVEFGHFIRDKYTDSLLDKAVKWTANATKACGAFLSKAAKKTLDGIKMVRDKVVDYWDDPSFVSLDYDQQSYMRMRSSVDKEYGKKVQRFLDDLDLYSVDESEILSHDQLRDEKTRERIQKMRDDFKINGEDIFYNISIRANADRMIKQYAADKGKGKSEYQLHDVKEADGKTVDIQGAAPTNSFEQNISSQNLKESVRLEGGKDFELDAPALETLKVPEDGLLTLKQVVDFGNAFAKDATTMLTKVKPITAVPEDIGKRILILSNTYEGMIGSKEYIEDYDVEKDYGNFLKGAKNWNDKFTNATKCASQMGNFFTTLGCLQKIKQGEKLTATEMYKLGTNPIKMFNYYDTLVNNDGKKLAITLNGQKYLSGDFLTSIDGMKNLYDSVNKFIETSENIEALEKFKNDEKEQGGKDIKLNSLDKQYGRMIFNSITARDQQYTNDRIDSVFGVFSGAIGTLKGYADLTGQTATSASLVMLDFEAKTVQSLTKYIKQTYFDDKKLYLEDIFGGEENYKKTQEKYNLSASDLDHIILQKTDCPSINYLANRIRAEHAMQIASNYNLGFEKGTDRYAEEAKLIGKNGKVEATDVYGLLGGNIKFDLALKKRKDTKIKTDIRELLADEKVKNHKFDAKEKLTNIVSKVQNAPSKKGNALGAN